MCDPKLVLDSLLMLLLYYYKAQSILATYCLNIKYVLTECCLFTWLLIARGDLS